MLLTVPWGYAVWVGRRDLDPVTGEAAVMITAKGTVKPLLTHTSLFTNCVTVLEEYVVGYDN